MSPWMGTLTGRFLRKGQGVRDPEWAEPVGAAHRGANWAACWGGPGAAQAVGHGHVAGGERCLFSRPEVGVPVSMGGTVCPEGRARPRSGLELSV